MSCRAVPGGKFCRGSVCCSLIESDGTSIQICTSALRAASFVVTFTGCGTLRLTRNCRFSSHSGWLATTSAPTRTTIVPSLNGWMNVVVICAGTLFTTGCGCGTGAEVVVVCTGVCATCVVRC